MSENEDDDIPILHRTVIPALVDKETIFSVCHLLYLLRYDIAFRLDILFAQKGMDVNRLCHRKLRIRHFSSGAQRGTLVIFHTTNIPMHD